MTETAHYLVGLDLHGRRVVVVGGGSVVARRLAVLADSGADIHIISPEVTPTVESFPGVTVHLRSYAYGDLDGAWYAMAATNDPAVNEQVVAEADELRIFCVRTDLASAGSAVTPATVRHDGLAVGVLASGDHRRSAAVRSAIGAALAGDGLVAGAAIDPAVPHPSGVALVGGGPGDPDLITVRGRRLLSQADVVVADRLAPGELLDRLGPNVELIDAAKVPYGRAMAQEAINEVLIDRARAGKFVVRLKGGDPFVYGRGFEEVQACTAAGVPVTVVPGISSSIAAPAAADIPVTHRGITHEVVIVSGHVAPDHPDSLVDWNAIGRMSGTVVLMMAVARIETFANALVAGGRPADTPVAIIENGTLPTQKVTRTTLAAASTAAEQAEVRPPAIVVIGPVAGLYREQS